MIKTAILAVQKALRVVPAHEQINNATEHELYPSHEERETSSLYRKNRDQIVNEDKHPCFFCGKTLEELEKMGYTIETHHWFEYSLWNALDCEKVKKDLIKLDFYGYAKEMGDQPVETPDDIRNLVAICSVCHRESGYGIHHATIPFVWARRALKDKNFDVLKRIKPLKPNKQLVDKSQRKEIKKALKNEKKAQKQKLKEQRKMSKENK